MGRFHTAMIMFFLSVSLVLTAQRVDFQHFSIDEGLSQSVVNCLFQDSEGVLWAGTQNGLNKYYGYDFITFLNSPEDSNSICGNWIYDIVEDQQGFLWIGTKHGVCRYNKSTNTFHHFSLDLKSAENSSDIVYGLHVNAQGHVLMNTPMFVYEYIPDTKNLLSFRKLASDYHSVNDQKIAVYEKGGLIYAGSKNELCVINKSKKDSRIVYDQNRETFGDISSIFPDKNGNIWIGSRNGLYVNFKNESLINKIVQFDNIVTRSIIQDKNDVLWIGTENGLFIAKYRYKNNKLIFKEKRINDVSFRIILDQIIDQSNNLWIGTIQGLFKTDLKPSKFRLYRQTSKEGGVDLSYNVVASLYKMNDSIIWVGTWGRGLNILNRNTGKVVNYAKSLKGKYYLENDFVHVIFKDHKSRFWIGTRDGLFIFNDKKQKFIRPKFMAKNLPPDLGDHRIYTIIQDRENRYWFATQRGIYVFRESTGQMFHLSTELTQGKRLSNNLVYDILEDFDGNIWVATSDGLNKINPKDFTCKYYNYNPNKDRTLSDNFVVSLAQTADKKIWIGTQSGLNFIEYGKDEIERYTKFKPIMKRLIYEIVVDNNQDLWLATQDGLVLLKPELNAIKYYTVRDGLQSQEFNLKAEFKAKDGELFFGGMNGFNSFYPDSLVTNTSKPDIAITKLHYRTTNNENVVVRTFEKPVHLYQDAFDITINFAALDYTNPEQNQYRYRMSGLSNEWIDIGQRSYVLFSNLMPGKYTFTVMGTNNDGVWSDESKALVLIVHPPWYTSFWAYAVYVLLVLLGIWLFFRVRQSKLIKERDFLAQNEKILIEAKEKAEESDRLKSAFLTNMSHEIRTPLNGILGFSKMLQKPDLKSDKLNKYSDIIVENGEQLLHIVNDILDISLIESGQINIDSSLVSLKSILEDCYKAYGEKAKNKNLELIEEIHDENNLTLNTDEKRLKQVLGNLIHNAIKFTEEGKVVFGCKAKGEHVHFYVKDTGIGISDENINNIFKPFRQVEWEHAKKKGGNGLGLSISRELVTLLGGKLTVRSKQDEGTIFSFDIPVK
jgi:signal transduction histidine kinase/ligand-binding sensor domain-containing protein